MFFFLSIDVMSPHNLVEKISAWDFLTSNGEGTGMRISRLCVEEKSGVDSRWFRINDN